MTNADQNGKRLKLRGLVVAAVVVCAATVCLIVVGGFDSVHDQAGASMEKSDKQGKSGAFTGGFVNIDDQGAMEDWARHMCRGVKLEQAAVALGTNATVPAVAHALMDRQVESTPIREAILRVCEDELREAN
jgi:hypothetical protein